MNKPDRILIMGIGNVLMGDEGVGVHAIKRLEQLPLPENVDLLDGGTGGFHLLSYLENYPVVIMIDATMDGNPPGTIDLKRPRFSSDFPIALSAHDIGLKDLIDAASFAERLPVIHLITVSIDNLDQVTVELSPEVARSLEDVEKRVMDVLEHIAIKDKNKNIRKDLKANHGNNNSKGKEKGSPVKTGSFP